MDSLDPTPDELRLAVVAADPLARAGLASMLGDEAGISVVAQLDLASAPETVLADAPDVIAVDLEWEIEDELERLQLWLELELPLLLLVASDRPAGPLWGLGAAGVLRRSSLANQIVPALRAAAAGLRVHDRSFSPRIDPTPGTALSEPLTPRELDVLQHLAEGISNRAIAEALSISEHTVKFHVTAILAKLGAESRTEAAIIAARAGLIVL